jgi:nucleotide-binding universal stress UspA family protein
LTASEERSVVNQSIISKILLATDFSDSAILAQVYAEYLAAALKASVAVLHVSESRHGGTAPSEEAEIQTKLREVRESIEALAVPVSIHRSTGSAGDQILSTARHMNADVIAMGMQGHTHVPYGLIGTTVRTVTKSGPCPVLTVPLPAKEASPCLFSGPEAVKVRRILAPVDFSSPSMDSLECAIHLAHGLKADLVLLHVVEPVHADWDLHRIQGAAETRDQWDARLGHLAEVMKTLGLSATYDVRTGTPPDSILACALQQGCDLLVMGTHGRGGREGVDVGSVAEAVLKQATCPVLTVKNPKFVGGGRPAIRDVLSEKSQEAATGDAGLRRGA